KAGVGCDLLRVTHVAHDGRDRPAIVVVLREHNIVIAEHIGRFGAPRPRSVLRAHCLRSRSASMASAVAYAARARCSAKGPVALEELGMSSAVRACPANQSRSVMPS